MVRPQVIFDVFLPGIFINPGEEIPLVEVLMISRTPSHPMLLDAHKEGQGHEP